MTSASAKRRKAAAKKRNGGYQAGDKMAKRQPAGWRATLGGWWRSGAGEYRVTSHQRHVWRGRRYRKRNVSYLSRILTARRALRAGTPGPCAGAVPASHALPASLRNNEISLSVAPEASYLFSIAAAAACSRRGAISPETSYPPARSEEGEKTCNAAGSREEKRICGLGAAENGGAMCLMSSQLGVIEMTHQMAAGNGEKL